MRGPLSNTQHEFHTDRFTERVILDVIIIIQVAIDRRCGTFLIFFGLKMVWFPYCANLSRPCELKLPKNVVNCIKQSLNIPKDHIRDSN